MKKSILSLIFGALIVGLLPQAAYPNAGLKTIDYTPQQIAVGAGLLAMSGFILYKMHTRAQPHALALTPSALDEDLKIDDAHNRCLIFDLGDVLITTNGGAAMREVGYKNFAAYAAKNLTNIFAIESMVRPKLLYPFLNSIVIEDPYRVPSYDAHGHQLPQGLCDWLSGKFTNEELLSFVDRDLEHYQFNNDAEKNLVRGLTTMMFTPAKLANTIELSPGACELIQRYKQHGIRLAILSNLDKELFVKLQQKYPTFFKMFDTIIISGEHRDMKPSVSIYNLTLNKVGLPAQQCIFIDDRPENIDGARAAGIAGIQCMSKRSWLPWKKFPDLTCVQHKLDRWLTGDAVVTESSYA